MILFFDTETTGFTRPNMPVDHPDQPHLVQLAAQLVRPDNTTMMEFSLIVDPGVPIPARATEVHGISDLMAAKYGVTEATAVDMFMFLLSFADVGVAHNAPFDKQVMETAIARRKGKAEKLGKPLYCTMANATQIVKAPPTPKMVAAGRTHFKSPNLGECIKHFFGEDFDGAHDAMNDVVGCRRVYFAINKQVAA
jgi:DNA polymerase III subunit epsilon